MPQIEIRSLGHRYARRGPWVLHDVELTLQDGALVKVTGRNGAGKSTLLRVLAGVVRPVAGTVAGRPAAVGYAPERFPTGQPFTVRRYLRHMARIRGLGRKDAKAAVGTITERLAMTELLRTPLRELSKGAAHKVGVAQAFLAPAELLVLDEPFAGLDAETRGTLTGLITGASRDGAMVVFSDHLQAQPGLEKAVRWQVGDGTVRRLEPGDAGDPEAENPPRPPSVTFELTVPQDEAERVERSLRIRGYEPKRVDR